MNAPERFDRWLLDREIIDRIFVAALVFFRFCPISLGGADGAKNQSNH
jgi:hypothetical protein